ncbi:MAG: phosphoenolpyruvate--protein phosphotransferase [Candidatus Omnitrophica bacterium]|nr:phosphoenolpyruvate--protein phosphotransferase [Candidatus Omnitrophota bacterium]MDD5351807.1 phosphoenolpyruvate--protein phosphotransferase [Candidatus Omnitrophota bacterium]MDD5550633.1 phosphoenolpyruvate--protein phosphotransferase [Candidatus Omnitrophota bacterium]
MLRGIPAAPGIKVGKTYLLGGEELAVNKRSIAEGEIPLEVSRFEDALIKTRKEILELQDKVSKGMGTEHAEIFDAHLLVLEDRMLIEEVISRVKKEKIAIDYAFSQVLKRYAEVFTKVEDEYLKERISDINDVGRRILRNLLGRKRKGLEELKDSVIVVAHDISPSDTAAMYHKNVIGFVTDIGGKTSHTAIMAKSLEIPAVVGLETATVQIKDDDTVVLDGNSGLVIVNPKQETLNKYERKQEKIEDLGKIFITLKDLVPVTLDGKQVELAANIELPQEIPSVKEHGVHGIGLYRTEFFYMNRKDLPTEEEQFQSYKYVAEEMKPYPVIIRTLDLGGDKFLSQPQIPRDMTPFLGWRAIRFCLARPDIFKTQLRAILRASKYGNLKIMYPMISGVEELKQAQALLEESKKELHAKKVAYKDDIDIGVMIEVPSAALTCDILSKEAKFFSIGTNDLIQYSLAVDRTNEKVAYLYEPLHPAVLRLIKNIIDAGHKAGIWVGMCGEMSSEPSFALLLLGLGLDEFSMPPSAVSKIKHIIRSVTTKQAEEIAYQALNLSEGKEVEKFTKEQLHKILPKFYPKA